ncbi:MAG TPA: ATP-binding protein [Bryobacteraceae bacterium]|nr:ATP-binding protein [Bryobacteraceae bacterium]
MRRTRSIQFRLTVWYACVLTAALALFSALIWFSLQHRLESELDHDLAARRARFETYFVREAAVESSSDLKAELEEFSQALPPSNYLELTGASGFEFRYPERGRASLRHFREVRSAFSSAGERFQLSVGASTESIHHTLELLRLLLVGSIPVVIAIACLAGAWLSRKALRPVDRITSSARSIGIENLSQRLPVPDTGDELQRLTEVWNSMLERLESAVKTLSQFAADASHELRTPLAVIRTGAELALRRARSSESYCESLSEIEAEAERMTQLVEDLLFLARSSSSTEGMPMQLIDPREIVSGVVGELHDLAAARRIRIETDPGENVAAISANGPALRRLVLVLMDNALKYSHADGEVRIVLSANAENVAISVRDFGIGISAADLPHIFQRFYRADKARSEGGYGLGLSLAATIAQLHGARIDAESTEGAGSVFTVTFPSRQARLAA